ncbi:MULTISPECIES: CopG family transcriptional regulator [unclassified Nocardia]|uniref:CopG family transcriptional regulator n=1 Tax=unclassified Nocardia TaxID=2637762 RepID=UPI001CE40CD4|nr:MULTISPECIES: CopG family transcriptional regulator [unclassified Nocardia]
MAMNLRLTEQNELALRAQAEAEGRSMNAVVNVAVAEYVERWQHRDAVRTEIAFMMDEHRELLDKLK